MRGTGKDRRKVNVPVGDDKRKGRKDTRKCPMCGSSLQQSIRKLGGGSVTVTFCTKCEYKVESRQIDEDRLKARLGFDAEVLSGGKKYLLEVTLDFIQLAGLKAGDTVRIEPIYAPGQKKPLKWVLKTGKEE